MSRANYEPEYRRRIRENAEQQQKHADYEGQRATESADIHKIVGAIEAIDQQYKRENDKRHSRHKWDRLWEVLGVVGLWLAAAVGLGAVMVASHDAEQQRGVMQGQLGEMKAQRLATIAQTRANIRYEKTSVSPYGPTGELIAAGIKPNGWAISPVWSNAGNTDAVDFRAWFRMNTFSVSKDRKEAISDKDCPALPNPEPLPASLTIANGGVNTQLAKKLSYQQAADILSGSTYGLMWGHVEYKDIYFPETPLHHFDWCIGILRNDLQGSRFSFLIVKQDVK